MRCGATTSGMLAAVLVGLLLALWPGAQAQAQGVTCPSAAAGEKLNIVTTGGVTTCTNIGTSFATTGIEILNDLITDGKVNFNLGTVRVGVAFRKITSAGNEQPNVSCVGDCAQPAFQSPLDIDADVRSPSEGVVGNWGYGTGVVTLSMCLSSYHDFISTAGCAISFAFGDGTAGSFNIPVQSSTIPSFTVGQTSNSPPPTIASISPTQVPYTGGEVVIRGSNLGAVTSVTTWNLSPPRAIQDQPFTIVSSEELRVNPSAPTLQLAGTGLYMSIRVNTAAGFASAPFRFIAPPIRITTTSLPAAAIGAPYSAQIMTADGYSNWLGIQNNARAYFSAAGLPSGVSIQESGLLAGTPTQTGAFEVTVSVNDYFESVTSTATRTFTLTVASSVSVTTSSLPGGTVGAPYTAPLAAAGSTAPYTFTATGLPAGLAVSGASITGTPTQAGTFTVAITATDSTTPTPIASLATQLSLAIGAGGKLGQTITFTQPTGVVFKAGATVALKATASSGLAVAFASTTPAACTVAGTTATIVKAGTCTVKASQAGNATYAAAADVSVSFAIATTPSLSATAVVTPDKFSRPGETLTFVITLANTGGTTATGIRMSEPRLANLACAATTLAAGAKLNCQGTTLTTTADLTAGSISITPQLTYTYAEATP